MYSPEMALTIDSSFRDAGATALVRGERYSACTPPALIDIVLSVLGDVPRDIIVSAAAGAAIKACKAAYDHIKRSVAQFRSPSCRSATVRFDHYNVVYYGDPNQDKNAFSDYLEHAAQTAQQPLPDGSTLEQVHFPVRRCDDGVYRCGRAALDDKQGYWIIKTYYDAQHLLCLFDPKKNLILDSEMVEIDPSI